MNTGWRNVIKDKPFQLVSTKDIGFFAAQAFIHPEQYKGRAISLAGDELTLDQYAAVFKRATGRDLEYANGFITAFIMWMMKDFGYMFRWVSVPESFSCRFGSFVLCLSALGT